jgi:hypothetical protein
MLAAIVIAVSILPRDDVTRESVSLIEVNRYYDGDGRLVFTQLIFTDVTPRGGEEITAWRMVNPRCQAPTRDWDRGGFVTTWYDSDSVMRSVHSVALRDTWTQYDPELAARIDLPQEQRRGLKVK